MAVFAVQPAGAQYPCIAFAADDRLFTCQLGLAVDALRSGFIVGLPRAFLFPAEYKVGGDLYQPASRRRAPVCQSLHGCFINALSQFGFGFRLVYSSVGRRIDNRFRLKSIQPSLHGLCIAQIEVVHVGGDDIHAARNGVLQGTAQLAVGACNQYPHGRLFMGFHHYI